MDIPKEIVNMNNKGWSGNFKDLVNEANARLKAEGKSPLLERTVRHYQQTGVISKGVKNGREAFFNETDLNALLDTKSFLGEGFGLKHIALINQSNYSTGSSVREDELKQKMLNEEKVASHSLNTGNDNLNAVDVVSALINKNNQDNNHLDKKPVVPSTSFLRSASSDHLEKTKALSDVMSTLIKSKSYDKNNMETIKQKFPDGSIDFFYSPKNIPNWLSIKIQIEKAALASDDEKRQAIKTLETIIKSIKQL